MSDPQQQTDPFGLSSSSSISSSQEENKDPFGVNSSEDSQGNLSGGFSDHLFDAFTPFKNILSAFGQGAKDGWGAEPLDSTGIKDFQDSHNSLVKSFNEAFLRPVIYDSELLGEAIPRGVSAVFGGLGEATGQAGEELVKAAGPKITPTSLPLGIAGEVLKGFAAGGGMEFAVPTEASWSHTAQSARAEGLIGEGEQGYFNTKTPTPENLEARDQAAKQAGMQEPPVPVPPVTDIHQIARAIDPYTFQEYDRLKDVKENIQLSINSIRSAKLNEYEKQEFSILADTGGDESQLPSGQLSRLQNIRNFKNDLYNTNVEDMKLSGPKGTNLLGLQDKLLATDYQLRDLAPSVAEAYGHAQDLIPEVEKLPDERKPQEGSQEALQPVQSPPEGSTTQNPPKPLQEAPTNPQEGALNGEGTFRQVEGTGEVKTRGLSKNVEAYAIEKGLTEGFGDLPEYKTLNIKDQAIKTADLINKNYDSAKEMLLSGRGIPPEIHPTSLLQGLEKAAIAKGDIETIREIATNKYLAAKTTTEAQSLRILAERDSESPISAIKNVQDARNKISEKNPGIKKAQSAEITNIKNEIKAIQSKLNSREKWISFIQSIECEGE